MIKSLTTPQEFIEIKAGLKIGIKPWDYRLLSPEEKAETLAYYVVDSEIEAYYASERAKMHDALKKKK